MTDSKTTFSVRDIPESWVDAAAEGPVGSPGPLVERRRSGRRLPTGAKPDLVTGALTGIAMTVISGAAWFTVDLSGTYTGPWLAVLLGVLVAIAVRLGSGPAGPEMRMTVGAALYIAGVLATTAVIVRTTYTNLYGRAPSAGQIEDIITSDYVTRPLVVLAWVTGLAVMAWTSFTLKKFRN